jgi:hypothetical protein
MTAHRWSASQPREVAVKVEVPDAMVGMVMELVQQCSGSNGATRYEDFKLWLKNVRLRFVTRVAVSATQRFLASEAFGEDNPAGIKFYLGESFKERFLTKIEEDVPELNLRVHELAKSSRDAKIRALLGADYEETALAHFWEMIKNQSQGQAGPLLVTGKSNILYIKDSHDNLRCVRAYWGVNHWVINEYSVEDLNPWDDGVQVVSKDV